MCVRACVRASVRARTCAHVRVCVLKVCIRTMVWGRGPIYIEMGVCAELIRKRAPVISVSGSPSCYQINVKQVFWGMS